MKRSKKLNSTALQTLVMGLIILAFIYLFYYFYQTYRDYRGIRAKENPPAAQSETIEPPVFFTFDPGNDSKYQLFSFKEKEQKTAEGKEIPPDVQAEQNKAPDYSILGVVKREHLLLVVRFHTDNRLAFIPEGEAINRSHRVKRLKSFQVVISDRSGREQTHKIFKLTNINFKEMPHDNKKRK